MTDMIMALEYKSARAAIDRLTSITAPMRELPKLQKGWIATIRSALGMTQDVFGTRLGVTKQRVSMLEKRERTEDITLGQLRETANALDCQLVYAFVPNEPLEAFIERRARAIATRELSAVERSMQLEEQSTTVDEDRIRDYIARHVTEKDLWRDD